MCQSTWYCHRGCNVFTTSAYDQNNPPECGACGSHMSTEAEHYDDAHEYIENMQIAECEVRLKLQQSN